ncbi:hypothetical protein [Nitratireductor sp. XY-223]|uniref:hypothetical protein n=1 Tax=Nitratireductor sp. XY-223 TaxID=2561926 RepID=UPI0010AB4912|nr:hypothetical protein [Nitratireductor sp. XY-223]
MTDSATGRLAPALGIDRVWREVVDFGEPTSGTGEADWGRKRISVARVSILDDPTGTAIGTLQGGKGDA